MVGILVLLLFSVSEVAAVSTECFYIAQQYSGTALLQEIYCEHGCCGTIENQRCCQPETAGLNKWMVAALALGGVFVFFALLVVVYCVIKYKNKKRERVSNTRVRGGDQINSVDLAIFRTDGSRGMKPPDYSEIYRINNQGNVCYFPSDTRHADLPPEYSATDGSLVHVETGSSRNPDANAQYLSQPPLGFAMPDSRYPTQTSSRHDGAVDQPGST